MWMYTLMYICTSHLVHSLKVLIFYTDKVLYLLKSLLLLLFMYTLGKVLKTALSLYCEQNQPFPSMDEIVICASKTTTEDVSSNNIPVY